MNAGLLELLRCPFCGSRVDWVEDPPPVRRDDRGEWGVLGCHCCTFPVVAGIPVMIADDVTRSALQQVEAGKRDAALLTLLGLDAERGEWLRALLRRAFPPTYRELLEVLCTDAEGTYFLYRFSDPTYLVAEALLRAVAQNPSAVSGAVLDVCGGSGHLTRAIATLRPRGDVVLADVHFWKLWLAKQVTAPDCEPVCCDGNSPLPFAPAAFSMAALADAFPYIWHKRLLADEMVRVVGPDGVMVMPHLHSANGENVSAGMTLPPSSYRDLFAALRPRLFSDRRLFRQLIDQGLVDLADDVEPDDLGNEPSLTLVASRQGDLFRQYDVAGTGEVSGALKVNPLYDVQRRGECSLLTLRFPTLEYEEEFAACRQYLPATVTVPADLTQTITPALLGRDYEELRRRRVIIDVPRGYC